MSAPRVRADARRNRERLLVEARSAFAADGPTASLEGIARAAGVGIGTLYRHFPSREALVEAVFRSELEGLCARTDDLLARHAPPEALRRFMDHYAGFVATKRGMAEVLRDLASSGAVAAGTTRERLTATLATFLRAGAAAGTLREDVRPDDLVTGLLGVFLATSGTDDPDQVARLLDLLVDGLRPPAPRT